MCSISLHWYLHGEGIKTAVSRSKKLRSIFSLILGNTGGTRTSEALADHFNDGEVTLVLTHLGLDSVDARKFFDVLDADGSGEIETDEFAMGCTCFKSRGRSVAIDKEVRRCPDGRGRGRLQNGRTRRSCK